jgi:DNA-binding transcriptional ArsR family regulator
MKSNAEGPEIVKKVISALQDLGFSMAEIRPILPKLTGTTVSEIANLIGMSKPTVTRTLMGHFGHPLVIREIAKVFQTPVEVMFPEKMDPLNLESEAHLGGTKN